MHLRIALVGLVLILGFPRSCQADSKTTNGILTACAAYGPDGSLAAATVKANDITLEITTPAGIVSKLVLPLRYPLSESELAHTESYSCRTFFDGRSDLIAIGASYGFPPHLQVAVVDARLLKWAGDWAVDPSGFFSLFLAGFLEETTSIVVSGEPTTKEGHGIQHGSLQTLLFTPDGQHLNPVLSVRNYASETDLLPFYVDANHNRLWYFRCVMVSAPLSRQPDCPIGWTTLIGDTSSSSEFNPSVRTEKRTDFWMFPQTFAAPDGNTIFFAETVAGVNTVWLVNVQSRTLSRLTLPKRRHFPNFEEIHGAAAMSPDGEIVAFPLVKEAVAFPYLVDNYVYKGADAAVVQLHPLRLLGIYDGGALAVDHRDGKARVLVYRKGRWEHHELADIRSRLHSTSSPD